MSSRSDRSISRRRLVRAAAAVPAVALGAVVGTRVLDDRPELVCLHQRTGEIYARARVEAGTVLTLSWIHSIELTRWVEHYTVTPEGFDLTGTEISSYGAGMVSDDGPVAVEGGRIRTEGLERHFDALRWINSHEVDYRIEVTGRPGFVDSHDLPHREPVALTIGRTA